ncbi:MAG: LD-carboxypeptidase [Proteiniphilum sp.]|nr:LD-carboxypeptidase [Proteiniphilum sp.]MDD4800478.1 LD-carboxypeptidase [Proteiniphilum sp.]
MKQPPGLRPHDRAVILSPAGRIDAETVHGAVAVLREWGLEPEIASHALSAKGRFSGRVEERRADLQLAFDDPAVRLVFCARGGYGVVHLLPSLDFTAIRAYPKWVVGYSDITALHAALQLHGIASLHGPMAKHLAEEGAGDRAVQFTHDVLTGKPVAYQLPVREHGLMNRTGTATGRLFGGNLSVFTSLLGTQFVQIPQGGIFFLEDIGETPYKVDRMIHQLRLAGIFDRIGGMIVGRFTEYEEDEQMDAPLLQSIRAVVEAYEFPLCFGFPVGHVRENYPLVMGVRAQLTVTEQSVSFTQSINRS